MTAWQLDDKYDDFCHLPNKYPPVHWATRYFGYGKEIRKMSDIDQIKNLLLTIQQKDIQEKFNRDWNVEDFPWGRCPYSKEDFNVTKQDVYDVVFFHFVESQHIHMVDWMYKNDMINRDAHTYDGSQDLETMTALSIAFFSNNDNHKVEMIKLLLMCGFDPNDLTTRGKTFFDIVTNDYTLFTKICLNLCVEATIHYTKTDEDIRKEYPTIKQSCLNLRDYVDLLPMLHKQIINNDLVEIIACYTDPELNDRCVFYNACRNARYAMKNKK